MAKLHENYETIMILIVLVSAALVANELKKVVS